MFRTPSQEDSRPVANVVENLGDPVAPVDLENSSNIIFFNLFKSPSSDLLESKGSDFRRHDSDSIPLKYCDAILSAIRNPLFNAKDVTFEDCADMLRWIGCYRDESWAIVEARWQNDRSASTFPRVVLECVAEFIGSQLENAMRVGRGTWGHRYPSLHERRKFCPELGEWTDILQNMMLVNSSWHGAARPLMGYATLEGSSTADLIQHPHFGCWTKEVYLSYPQSSQIPHPKLGSNRFLRALFARIPGTRLASLSLMSELLSDEFLVCLCEDIVTLGVLEELNIEVESGDKNVMNVVQRISANIARSRHPSLCILRISIGRNIFRDSLKLEDASALPRTLATLPNLNSIQVSFTDWVSNGYHHSLFVGGLVWHRVPSSPGSAFTLGELRINWLEDWEYHMETSRWNFDDKLKEMLQSVMIVEFAWRPNLRFTLQDSQQAEVTPPKIASLLTSTLDLCLFIRKVVFRTFQWDRMKLLEQIRTATSVSHRTVEELVIMIAHLPSPPSGASGRLGRSWYPVDPDERDAARLQFSLNDRQLSETLALGLFPSLRVLKVVFPNESLDVFVEGFEYGPGYGSERLGKCGDLLIPHTRGTCAERGIKIYVDLE